MENQLPVNKNLMNVQSILLKIISFSVLLTLLNSIFIYFYIIWGWYLCTRCTINNTIIPSLVIVSSIVFFMFTFFYLFIRYYLELKKLNQGLDTNISTFIALYFIVFGIIIWLGWNKLDSIIMNTLSSSAQGEASVAFTYLIGMFIIIPIIAVYLLIFNKINNYFLKKYIL